MILHLSDSTAKDGENDWRLRSQKDAGRAVLRRRPVVSDAPIIQARNSLVERAARAPRPQGRYLVGTAS
jgi:hypothetical protein